MAARRRRDPMGNVPARLSFCSAQGIVVVLGSNSRSRKRVPVDADVDWASATSSCSTPPDGVGVGVGGGGGGDVLVVAEFEVSVEVEVEVEVGGTASSRRVAVLENERHGGAGISRPCWCIVWMSGRATLRQLAIMPIGAGDTGRRAQRGSHGGLELSSPSSREVLRYAARRFFVLQRKS
ncbi:hypothetical protein F4777DRAFT_55080 [Nemania sp. FL0916]|nr:hypothetical protein F4777DRAFT_55080 [Nemania sp. FL0916]